MPRGGSIGSLVLPDWRYALGLFAAAMLFVWHPFSGGARGPTIVLSLLGLWFWVSSWRSLSADKIQHRWLLLILCLAIPNLLSLPGSYSVEHTGTRLAQILAMFLVGSVLIEVLRQEGVLDLLQKVLGVLATVWIVDALVQLAFGRDILGVPLSGDGRVVGLYRDHLYLPWSLVLILPILLWQLIARHQSFAISALLASGVVIVGTGVRSAVVAWFIVASFFLLYLKTPKKWLIVAGVIGVIGVGVALSPIAQQKLKKTHIEEINFDELNKLLSSRMYLWETGWRMFLGNPLTGVGGDAYRAAYGDYSYRPDDPFRPGGHYGPQNAHQLYLSLIAETGVSGLAGLLLLMVLLVRWYLEAPERLRDQAKPYAIGLLAVTFPINSQPLIYKTWWVPLLVYFVAAMIVSLDEKRAMSS